MGNPFYSLATRSNFNKALNHFFKVNEVVDYLESKRNLADVVNADLDQNEILTEQILPIVGAVIRDKYQYSYDSYNVHETVTDFAKLIEETSKWTALDILIVYYTPSGEIMLVNPKNRSHWERVRELAKDQAMVLYARHLKEEKDPKIELEAIMAIEEMISGRDVFINKDFIDRTAAPKVEPQRAAPQAAAVAAGQRRMTPKYSVQVSNELFHNGNVEAWKRIIESYKVSHPDLEVMIFYENELINDINTLFKWGKVKRVG